MIDDPLLEARLVVSATARSGFPHEMSLAYDYELSGPLVGVGADLLAPPAPTEPVVIGIDDIAQLVHDLNCRDGNWAAAVVDDAVVLANSRGPDYIPPGIHLPHNINMVHHTHDDGLFWRVYGWPPAERLVAYAQHYDVLDRMTTVVAQRGRRPMTSAASQFTVGWVDPFEWVRPSLGDRGIELVEVTFNDPPCFDVHRRWGSARRGHHRLEVVGPDHYAELVRQARADDAAVRHVVQTAAELTVAAAKTVMAYGDHAFSDALNGLFGDGERLPAAVLHTVATTSPQDIASRRLRAQAIPRSLGPPEAMGLPADDAPVWAHDVDHAYSRAKMHAESSRIAYYDTARYNLDATSNDLAEHLHACISAELVAVALEAIVLWSADPLPVADIEYAARSITGTW